MKEKSIYHLGYVLSFLLAICLLIYLFFQYDNIPSSIATHYDVYGRIDMMGDKQSLINLCVIAGLTPCFFYCAETTPQYLNIPLIKKEKKSHVKSVLHQMMM